MGISYSNQVQERVWINKLKNFLRPYKPLFSFAQWVVLTAKINASKVKRQISRPLFPTTYPDNVFLHLGCGKINHPDFINIDGFPFPHVHYVRSIADLSNFKNGSVDLIYACHCLEHFPYGQVASVLTEWHRVLKQDGTLRISVPDFDRLLKIYEDTGHNIDMIIGPLMGGHCNRLDYHLTVFTAASLSEILTQVGFQEVREWQPGSGTLTTFDDWSSRQLTRSGNSYPISLNLEATKAIK